MGKNFESGLYSGLGDFLRNHLLKDKGFSGWRQDKEKFKIDLVNDIKNFLFTRWEKSWVPSLVFDSNGQVINSYKNVSGRFYHNESNIIGLKSNAGKSPYFITLSKIKEQGGTILDKTKITSIVSYVPMFKPVKKVAEGEKRRPDWMMPRFHEVINVDFVSGIKKPGFHITQFKELELNQYVEAFIKELKKRKRIPELVYDQSDRCFYKSNPPVYSIDVIHLVQIHAFKNIGEYYSTLFHEITHSTKSKFRLGQRDKKNKTNPDYANEELVAEMGAMIVCTELGLEYNRQNSLSYLKGWLEGAKKKNQNVDDVLIKAYSYACDAADYLLKDIDLGALVPETMQERAELKVVDKDKEFTELFKDDTCRVINHLQDERVKLFFKSRPEASLIKKLKEQKFSYAPTAKAWQKKNTSKNIEETLQIVNHKVVMKTKKDTSKKSSQLSLKLKNTKTKKAVVPSWLAIIRSFLRFANKERTQTSLRRFLKVLQASFDAKRTADKPTPHIALIREIQDTMVKQINRNISKKKLVIKVSDSFILKLTKVSQSVVVSSKLEKPKVKEESLSGLGIVPSTELVKMNFKTLPFDGDWKTLIGNPSVPFHLMFYGRGGSGKSTLSVQFAHYLASKHNFKVLFVAKEEGISQTAQDKFKRLNAVHPNVFIDDGRNLEHSGKFDAVVLDSVNELNLSPDDIRRLQERSPNTSTIQIFKATKEGKFLGQNDYSHMVQAVFRCEDGVCVAEKNRFGGNETIKIKFQ